MWKNQLGICYKPRVAKPVHLTRSEVRLPNKWSRQKVLSVWPWLSLLTCTREGVGATWLLSYGRGRIDFSLGWSIWLPVPKPTHFYALYPKSHSPIKKKVEYLNLFPPLIMICSCRFHFTSSFGFYSCFIGWNLHYYSTTIGREILCSMLILIWYQGNDKWLDELFNFEYIYPGLSAKAAN